MTPEDLCYLEFSTPLDAKIDIISVRRVMIQEIVKKHVTKDQVGGRQ